MIDRKELRKKVPHGYMKKIAERAGVNQVSVSEYFGYKNNSEKIENAVLEVLVELSEKKKKLLALIL